MSLVGYEELVIHNCGEPELSTESALGRASCLCEAKQEGLVNAPNNMRNQTTVSFEFRGVMIHSAHKTR